MCDQPVYDEPSKAPPTSRRRRSASLNRRGLLGRFRWWRRFKTWYKHQWIRGVSPQISQRQLWRAAQDAFSEIWMARWYPYYLLVVVSIAYGLGSVLLMFVLPFFVLGGSNPSPLLALVATVLALPACAAVTLGLDLTLVLVLRPLLHKPVRRGIRRRGIEVCVSCGYLLTSLPPDLRRCPECGAPREPFPDVQPFRGS